MARICGFGGGIYGRSGEVVFSKGDNGKTIMKKYQPVVANPRTNGQLMQRAKMNVVGQFVGMCPNSLLAPLAKGSNRMNRASLSSRLLKAASVVKSGENFIADFDPSVVKFATGSQNALTSINSVDIEESKVTITATNNVPDELLGSYGDRFVVGVLSSADNTLYDAIVFMDHVVTTSGAQTAVINLNHPLEEGQTLVVWRVPFVLNATGAAVAGRDIYIGDGAITAVLARSSNALVQVWGDTVVVAVDPFAPGE